MLGKIENRELLASETAAKQSNIASFPAIFYLESQRGCPYDCIMCTVPKTYGRNPTEMPTAVLERLAPYLKYAETLAIHGNGEALLSKQIDDYVHLANENDCFLHCNSTGFPLNKRLSAKLVEAKLDIRFSIHAGTAKTYKRIMDDDLWATARKIDNLMEMSRAKGRPENTFWLSYIVVRDNVDEASAFLDFAHQRGIDKVRFMNLHPNKRTVLGTRRDSTEARFIHIEQANSDVSRRFNEQLPELEAKSAELGITIGSGSMAHWSGVNASLRDITNRLSTKVFDQSVFPLIPQDGQCVVPWTGQVQVEQNGDVGLCCAVKHVIGNVLETDFSEIWHGTEMNAIRASFERGKSPRVCGYCRGIDTDEYAIPVNQLIDVKRVE